MQNQHTSIFKENVGFKGSVRKISKIIFFFALIIKFLVQRKNIFTFHYVIFKFFLTINYPTILLHHVHHELYFVQRTYSIKLSMSISDAKCNFVRCYFRQMKKVVEIWILKSVEKMGGVIPGMGKMLTFMVSCFGQVLGWRKI